MLSKFAAGHHGESGLSYPLSSQQEAQPMTATRGEPLQKADKGLDPVGTLMGIALVGLLGAAVSVF